MIRSTEHFIDKVSSPSKSYLPIIGRFLLMSCFIEDSIRIVLQWNSQLEYIHEYRNFPYIIASLFLGYFVIGMLVSSLCVIFRFKTFAAGCVLLSIIALQCIAYGLLTDFEFVMRNISIIGGLLMLLAEDHSTQEKKSRQSTGMIPGLPNAMQDYTKSKATWLSLLGRILLVALVVGIVFAGELNVFRLLFGCFCLLVSVLIIVGFKAKFSAACLLASLTVFNVVINNWWSFSKFSNRRDFLMFDFFQTLSVIGGLVLLVVTGPGHISIDEKQKDY